MKPKTVILSALPILLVIGSAAAVHVIDDSQSRSVLFVQSATGGEYTDGVLVLHNVPNTVYFSDRPSRMAGHISNESFLTFWNDRSKHTFHDDPPNAVLSMLTEDHSNVVIELLSPPSIKGENLSYEVSVLSGRFPGSFGSCSLFIDPTSVNGQITD